MCHLQWVAKGLERPQRLSCPCPAIDRQQGVDTAASCCSQPGECPLQARGRSIPTGSICALGHCTLPWEPQGSQGKAQGPPAPRLLPGPGQGRVWASSPLSSPSLPEHRVP